MARKLIHCIANESGKLRCDNLTCNHVLPEALEFNESLIGHPCPKCGFNMLTRKDYEGQMRMMAVVDFLNRWFSWLPFATEEPLKGMPSMGIRVAQGKLDFEERTGRPDTGEYSYALRDDDDVMTLKEYLGCVEDGGFIDDDGFGNPVRDGLADDDIWVYPSDGISNIPKDATHIVWYNR